MMNMSGAHSASRRQKSSWNRDDRCSELYAPGN